MKPINNFIAAVGLTLALSVITNNAHAQVSNMQEKVKNYFLQTLKKKQNEETEKARMPSNVTRLIRRIYSN